MSDYKQTRASAGKVTAQYGEMLRNLDDELVDRLNDRRVCSLAQNSCRNDHVLNQAEARIEELKAKLAKAMQVVEMIASADVDAVLGQAVDISCEIIGELMEDEGDE